MFDTSKIGHSFPPFTVEIERNKLQELVLAIGDNNPIYQSKQAAQAVGYQDVAVPPTMGTFFLFWENSDFVEQLKGLGVDVTRILHREEEYEYLAPLQPRETLTGVMTVQDGSVRKGPRNSTIELITLQLRYSNQQGQPVLVATTKLVVNG